MSNSPHHHLVITLLAIALCACGGAGGNGTPEPETTVTSLYLAGWNSTTPNNGALAGNEMTQLDATHYQFSATLSQSQLASAPPLLPAGFQISDQSLGGGQRFGGCQADKPPTLGESYPLCVDSGINIPLTITNPGTYQFDLDLTTANSPHLTIHYRLPPSLMRGADISSLAAVEAAGGQCREQGQVRDCLAILKDHGFNYVRLRLWQDPSDSNGVSYGGGNNDLATVTALAVRAKALGFKLLVDLHYSDFWADPGHQLKPKNWQALDMDSLADAVYHYSHDVIVHLQNAGAGPDMVQIGNEIGGGMLWPEGKSWGQGGGEFDRLSRLLKAGSDGVRDAARQPIELMLHLAEGGDNSFCRWWFDAITARGVEFDLIGLSYYPYWGGPVAQLQANMTDLASRYAKPVVVVETAYAFTLDNGDQVTNVFGPEQAVNGGYPATVAGQRDAVQELLTAIMAVPGNQGLGLFYWEPVWLPVDATWATAAGLDYLGDDSGSGQQGSGWENQALFDFDGNALESLAAFE